jgi:hypothetical protein
VSLDVENFVKTVNTFSVEVVENVTSLKNSVEEYATTNVTRVKNLMTKNQDIQMREDKFKGLFDASMSGYAEHSKLINDNTKVTDQSSAEDLIAAKSLVDQSKEITENVSDKRNQTFANIEEENVCISD